MKEFYTPSEINESAKNNLLALIEESESGYRNQIKEVINYVSKNKSVKFILLAGPSSSGKTTTSLLMQKYLKRLGRESRAISLDDFFVERQNTPKWEDGSYNYESINAIDWQLFDNCVEELLAGNPIPLPVYNFLTGKKEFSEPTVSEENEIIIIEGLHALNKIIDNFIPTKNSIKVYISVDSFISNNGDEIISRRDIRLVRRSIRDAHTRGTTVEETFALWDAVNRGEDLYITPFKNSAHFFINSFHPYELGVYKGILKRLKAQKIDVSHLEKFLNNFVEIDKNSVPEFSLLREFVY